MLDVEMRKLDTAVADLQTQLRDGLVTVDIVDRTSGITLVGFNSSPAAAKLFPQMADVLDKSLDHVGLPMLNKFFLLDLEGDHSAVVLRSDDGDMMSVLLIDNTKTNFGMLMGVSIPKTLESMAASRR